MIQRQQSLKDIELQVLDKVATAFNSIPLLVLEKFPGFNSQTYQDLKVLRQHLKAKIRLMQKKLDQFNQEEQTSQASFRHDEFPDGEDLADFLPRDVEEPRIAKNNFLNPKPSTAGSSNEFYNGTMAEKTFSPRAQDSEPPPAAKKSTFKLKRPVIGTVPAEVTKHIGNLLEKSKKPVRTEPEANESDFRPSSYFLNSNAVRPSSQESQKSTGSTKSTYMEDSWGRLNDSFGRSTIPIRQ